MSAKTRVAPMRRSACDVATNVNGVVIKNIPQRVKYPNSELTNNRANYDANASNIKDDYYSVLFWAKELK